MKKRLISFVILVVADLLCIFSCFLIAYFIRDSVLPEFFPSLRNRPLLFSAYFEQFYMYFVWVAVFMYEKLYTRRFVFWEEVQRLSKSTTISIAITMLTVYITQQYLKFSRLIIVLAWLLILVVLPAVRYVIKLFLIKLNLWKKKVIIIGAEESSVALIKSIEQNKTLGYEVVGCLTGHREKIGSTIDGVKVLGHYDEIAEWKIRTGFDDVIVTFPDLPRGQLVPLLKKWELVSENIRYIPRTGDLITTGVEIENIGKMLSLTVRKNLHKPWNIFLKFVFEYIVALILFVLFIPFALIIAFEIKLESPGPVFFEQKRGGKKGKRIPVIKFRSMYKDNAARLTQYLKENPEVRREWDVYKKIRGYDPRVTRVGRFLRKYSLDEIPQLINVLKGEMSLVGPRPYILDELEENEAIKSILFLVKPGITGLWQTSGRSSLSFEDRLNLDESYIRNWSLWMDIIILIKTVQVAVSGKGAF
jgi:Undecaprenyl-phosphate galactose phosphotransferase WbaP